MENKFPNAPLGFHPEFITDPGGGCIIQADESLHVVHATAHSSLWLIFQHSPQAVSKTILRSIVTDATNLSVHDLKASGPLEYLGLILAAELWNWQWESLTTVSAHWGYI